MAKIGFLSFVSTAARQFDFLHILRLQRNPRRTRSDDSFVHGIVEDTGKGIPSENLRRLFEPFFSTKVAGRCLLIIDYETLVREVLAAALESDYEVTKAQDGLEARRLLQGAKRYDVILCDLMMPKVSGAYLYRWARSR